MHSQRTAVILHLPLPGPRDAMWSAVAGHLGVARQTILASGRPWRWLNQHAATYRAQRQTSAALAAPGLQ